MTRKVSTCSNRMRSIVGWDGYYVDESGKIFSSKWGYLRELKQMKCRGGYYIVGLCKASKRTMVSVHRIVAETFTPNPDNLPVINHINGIKTDNRVENLEWCTQQYNTQEYFRLRNQKAGYRSGHNGVALKASLE